MPIPKATMPLLAEVLDERAKQIAIGFIPEHDDAAQRGELAQAAAAQILAAITRHSDELSVTPPPGFPGSAAVPWPAVNEYADKVPLRPVRRGYIVAITMLLAEVERLDRLRDAGEIEYCGGCGALVWKDEAVVDVEGVVLCPECAAGSEVAYANEPDIVARFLRERCDRDLEGHETASDLYTAFLAFCVEQGIDDEKALLNIRVFSLRLQELPWITKIQAFGAFHYKGVRLRREG
ncbi:hypothetical protein DesfrDRAFT_0073 [Solidesulfovibrio fructosivorans JJ]]|uniref:Uncharacterized protein n=1 Tax=Solidesulfovibrio fructosivorans JJ] TaxID=596151 RepID=E1JR24_SOLFR|nr:hypothetical protein [Solidesulfovibrio fructosivorans]EFL53025.1 hypothetical protein DesfrDRAFT_0073 [Solidesulfovibrio fructosivorans JJ]]